MLVDPTTLIKCILYILSRNSNRNKNLTITIINLAKLQPPLNDFQHDKKYQAIHIFDQILRVCLKTIIIFLTFLFQGWPEQRRIILKKKRKKKISPTIPRFFTCTRRYEQRYYAVVVEVNDEKGKKWRKSGCRVKRAIIPRSVASTRNQVWRRFACESNISLPNIPLYKYFI